MIEARLSKKRFHITKYFFNFLFKYMNTLGRVLDFIDLLPQSSEYFFKPVLIFLKFLHNF